MTRINIVEPEQLTKQHLSAEYRELPRIFSAVRKAIESGKDIDDYSIPSKYTIGKGHVTFFYNKLGYLARRWKIIRCTLINKYNYNLEDAFMRKVRGDMLYLSNCHDFWNYYTPTPEEIYLNMYRLSNRQYSLGDDNDKHVLDVHSLH